MISGVGTEYQAIRSWCQLGGYGNSNLAWGMFGKPEWETYNNVCIAWFRYVLFYMMAPIETVKWVEATAEKLSKPPIQLDKDAFINLMAAKFYISFVRKTLLEPIGITRADMTHLSEYDPRPEPLKESTQTLYYRFPVPNVPELGFYPWDWTEIGGGGGWIISARDLSRFWAHLRYGKILSDASLGLLFSYSSPNDSFVTSARQDAWGIHFNKRGNASDGIGGYESWVWDFPGNIQLTIVSNFQTPNLGTNVIVPAYQQAWQKDKKV